MANSHEPLRDCRPHPSRAAYANFHGSPRSNQERPLSSMSTIKAEILRDQLVVAKELSGSAKKRTASRIEDHCVIGDVECELAVLLDENDRLPLRLQALDGLADFGDELRREPF